jgi:transcriptional regulator with XRE-family HTH domain
VTTEGEQLAKLIKFLRLGEAEVFSPSAKKSSGKKKSGRKFALEMEVSQTTVRRWESGGGIEKVNIEKLANRLGKTTDELSSYLRGEVPLEDFIQGITETRPSRRLDQILQWLPLLRPHELFAVVQMGFSLLPEHFGSLTLQPSSRKSQNQSPSDNNRHDN